MPINDQRRKPRPIVHMVRHIGRKLRLLDAVVMGAGFHFPFVLRCFDLGRREIEDLAANIHFQGRNITQRSPASLTRRDGMNDAAIQVFHLAKSGAGMTLLSAGLFARRWARGTLFVKTVRRWGQMTIGDVFFVRAFSS